MTTETLGDGYWRRIISRAWNWPRRREYQVIEIPDKDVEFLESHGTICAALPVSFALEPEEAAAERRAWEMLRRYAMENSHRSRENERRETPTPPAGPSGTA